MRFNFSRNKYKTELLIDCFQKKGTLSIESPKNPFIVSFYEIIFITSGKGKFKLDNEIIYFKRGTVLLLPPNKWREWHKIDNSFEAIYLIFEEESISTFFNDALYLYRLNYFYNVHTPSFINLTESDLSSLLPRLDELKNELGKINKDSSHFLRSILYYTLIQLNRHYQKTHNIQSEFYQKANILKFKKLLEENIQTKHKVKEYAILLGISTSHLNKLLKTYFGKNCSEIIQERLIAEIKRNLLFSDKSISEISYELNFSEPSNFNRFFQKLVKMTPNQYRNQNDNS
jgi:AraC-like DNA-binding protein